MSKRKRTIFRGEDPNRPGRGEKRVAYNDTVARKARKRAAKKLNAEHKAANTRAKYGPRGKPAPVTVKTLDGAVIATVSNALARNGNWFRPETLDEARERRAAWMREAER